MKRALFVIPLLVLVLGCAKEFPTTPMVNHTRPDTTVAWVPAPVQLPADAWTWLRALPPLIEPRVVLLRKQSALGQTPYTELGILDPASDSTVWSQVTTMMKSPRIFRSGVLFDFQTINVNFIAGWTPGQPTQQWVIPASWSLSVSRDLSASFIYCPINEAKAGRYVQATTLIWDATALYGNQSLGYPYRVIIQPQGKYLAISWSLAPGLLLLDRQGHGRWLGHGHVISFDWSPDGQTIAYGISESGCSNNRYTIWSVRIDDRNDPTQLVSDSHLDCWYPCLVDHGVLYFSADEHVCQGEVAPLQLYRQVRPGIVRRLTSGPASYIEPVYGEP